MTRNHRLALCAEASSDRITTKWDFIAASLITLVAILLRYVDLATIPAGVHGDEAMAVLEGRRVLRDGWFGVWASMANGFPAGFIYLAAPMVWLFGDNILAVRYLSSGLDVITVIALYMMLRRSFGIGTAVTGSGLLATSAWHIHFSRIAFPNILWPTLVILACLALGEAVRSTSPAWWSASGVCFALAIYSYNSHFLYLGVLLTFIAWHFFGWSALGVLWTAVLAVIADGPLALLLGVAAAVLAVLVVQRRFREVAIPLASFAIPFAIVSAPMASFILTNDDVYFGRGRDLSIFRTTAWTGLEGPWEQVHFLLGRYWEFWVRLTHDPRSDSVDGSGAVPVVPLTALALCVVGAGFGLLRHRHPLVHLALFTILAMPLAAVATNDLALRRAMIIAPFLAVLGGIGSAETIRLCWQRQILLRVAGCALVAALLTDAVVRSVDGFFNHTVKSEAMHWVMSPEWVHTVNFMDTLPEGSYVYLYSDRWPFAHETRILLALDTTGESRGDLFGEDSLEVDPADGNGVIILLDKYQALLPDVQRRYPGGDVITGPLVDYAGHSQPAYVAYVLPVQAPGSMTRDLNYSA